jgi:chromosome partitioning protein
MAGTVVSVAQQKGGAGKTTLTIQLGMAWRAMGKRIIMLDIDPQGSLTAWSEIRKARLGEDAPGPDVRTLSGWRLGSELTAARDEADHVLIDCPPHAETDTKNAIRLADLTLLPVQPNGLDLWATWPTLELAATLNGKALLVLNRVPARGKVADGIRAEIKANKWPLAKAWLGSRQAFQASIGEGRGVAETSASSPAGREIEALAREIRRRLR